MNLTKNFTLEELVRTRQPFENQPPAAVVANLQLLCSCVLQPLRDAYGMPINVNSGYRSPQVNTAVRGAVHSQHLLGQAADIVGHYHFGDIREENKRLYNLIVELKRPFDQLIIYGDWAFLHVSYSSRHRRQVLINQEKC